MRPNRPLPPSDSGLRPDSLKSEWRRPEGAAHAPETARPLPSQAAACGGSVDEALGLASRHLSAGDLPLAESLLLRILADDPAQAHALHLLGIVCYRLGQPKRALDLVGQAVSICADIAQFHANLAEMCRQQGRLDDAVRHGLRAVQLDPQSAAAHANLGVALYDVGNYEAAESCHHKALALLPGMLHSLNNLGSILRQRKDRVGAQRWYREALAVQPDYVESLSNLGAVLLEDGRPEDAAPLLERALRLSPDYPEALCNLGLARLGMSRISDAAELFTRCLQLRAGHPEAVLGMADVRRADGQLSEAERLLEALIERDPKIAAAHSRMGRLFTELGRVDEAQAAYRRALAIDPEMSDALVGWADLQLGLGAFGEADTLLHRAIELAPNDISAWYHLAQITKVQAGDAVVQALESLSKDLAGRGADTRAALHYALGKSYDDMGDYQRAFQSFSAGARIKRGTLNYDSGSHEATLQRIAEMVDAAFIGQLQGAGNASDVPVFVLGMPRSGTTLTEQIIASHPQAFGAGELSTLMQIASRPAAGAAQLLGYPFNLRGLSRETVTEWGNAYVRHLTSRAPGARRITDKMPGNYQLLGLIALMLPNARIVHVTRNPVDTCLSCFTCLFARHQEATYDLTELGHHFASYARLMRHWHALMPEGFLEVRYEDLVANTEAEARRLIDFCGLPWDDGCLAFFDTKRNVRTASVMAVRQPVYTSSVDRWRRYEPFLGPLLDALGEFAPAR